MSSGIRMRTKRSAVRLLAVILSATLLVGSSSAAGDPLTDGGENLHLFGDILAAVNTNFSVKSNTSGSFYAQESTFSVGEMVFNRYVDKQTGEEIAVIEPMFEPLVFQGTQQVNGRNLSLRSQGGYSVGDVRIIRDEDGTRREMCCLYEGSYCTVWGSTQDASFVRIGDNIAKQLGEEFDRYYPDTVSTFGTGYDADGDGKVAIFCYDIEKDYESGLDNSFIAGFFNEFDMIDEEGFVNGFIAGKDKYTCGMDAIHLDTYPGMGRAVPFGDVSNIYSTLVHEYQHLINFSDRISNRKYPVDPMEVYLNEAFAMAAEHMICGSSACSERIDYFNGSGYTRGSSLTYWGNTLSSYSNSYLFGQYLRTRYAQQTGRNGDTLFRTVFAARTPENDDNTLGIIAQLLGTTEKRLVMDFWAAVYLKQPQGNYGFNGEPWADSITPRVYPGISNNTSGILSGGVKYYAINGSFSGTSKQNVSLMSMDDTGVLQWDDVLVPFDATLTRTASGAIVQITPSDSGYICYALSDQVITDLESLSEAEEIVGEQPWTLTVDVAGGEGAQTTFYYTLLNRAGEHGALHSLTVPAYSFPVTILPGEGGSIKVKWNDTPISSGDRVINGQTVTVETVAQDGFRLKEILVDDVPLTQNSFTVTGSHTIRALFEMEAETGIHITGAHSAYVRLCAPESGQAIVAFYDRNGGQMIAAQQFAVQAGDSVVSLMEERADLTAAACKVILLNADGNPQGEAMIAKVMD